MYVLESGSVYRISKRNFRRLLRDVAGGLAHWTVEGYGGKYVGRGNNILDLSPDRAADLLNEIK